MSLANIGSKWSGGSLIFFRKDTNAAILTISMTTITAAVNFVGNLVGNVTGNLTGNVTGNVAGTVAGYALKSEARTATADGTGTGTISAGTTHVVVTVDDANKIIKLPAPVPGLKITLINGATGYELRSSDPATIGINGGTGANAESAIGADTVVKAECVSATNWIAATVSAAGVVGVAEVAA